MLLQRWRVLARVCVYASTFYRWIDEKQKGNSLAKVFCPQCNKAYTFSLPKINNMVRVLDFAEKTTSKSCPYIAGGLFVGAAYWSAVTYGAITVMQVRIMRLEADVRRSTRLKSNQIKCVYFPPKLSSQWDTNQIQIYSKEKCTIAQKSRGSSSWRRDRT